MARYRPIGTQPKFAATGGYELLAVAALAAAALAVVVVNPRTGFGVAHRV